MTLRDVANADYAVQKLADLSADAASGTQPFFFVMGFHKVRARDIAIFRPEFNASTAAAPAVRCAAGVLRPVRCCGHGPALQPLHTRGVYLDIYLHYLYLHYLNIYTIHTPGHAGLCLDRVLCADCLLRLLGRHHGHLRPGVRQRDLP